MKQSRLILLLLAVAFCACSKKGKDEPTIAAINHSKDTYLCTYYRSDSALVSLYLAPTSQQIEHIILTQNNTPDYDIAGDYRVPTKDEAAIIRNFTIPDAVSERYLCLDLETETWYTFVFGCYGNITKAGGKTKYTLRPVWEFVHPKDTIIEL